MHAHGAEQVTTAGARIPQGRLPRSAHADGAGSLAQWSAALQRAVGNRVATQLMAFGGAAVQRQGDEAAPAFGEDAPIPLDGPVDGGAEQACPAGVTENIQTPSEVPISVTADSPSQWLNDVSAKLDDSVGHVVADPKVLWCIGADDKSVSGVSLQVTLKKKVARPVRGHGLAGPENDPKWTLVQDMAKAINDHEDRHMAIYKAAWTGLAQKLKDLRPPPGKKKLTDADVRKVYDDAICAAQKKQEELDAKEGTIAVNPDEKGFTTKGATHDYTTGCRSAPATP